MGTDVKKSECICYMLTSVNEKNQAGNGDREHQERKGRCFIRDGHDLSRERNTAERTPSSKVLSQRTLGAMKEQHGQCPGAQEA